MTDLPPSASDASAVPSAPGVPDAAAPTAGTAPDPTTDPTTAPPSGPTSGTAPAASDGAAPAGAAATGERHCPACGTANPADATFCEACGTELAASALGTGLPQASAPEPAVAVAATPQTAPAGEESPLDVGWTGAVPSTRVDGPGSEPDDTCPTCHEGRIVDGWCDRCGSPPPNPRDHFAEAPAPWVAGLCDIGRRHSRNEDAMSLSADEAPGSRAVLVVCDGVSMATDSHIASLAAAQAARAVLDQPFPRGAGTPEAWAVTAGRALTAAVTRANEAVTAAVVDDVPNPPSCTFVAAVVEDGVVVAGNVGDSRAYWLPDADAEPARQLGQDDSFAQEQMAAGVPREEAETGPHAHSITRWLGRDAPDDLTPHLTTLTATAGWLLVCSDGLWNYRSEAEGLRALLRESVARVGDAPDALARALVDFANEQGGRDNITVALARLAGQGSTGNDGATTGAPEEGDPIDG